MKYVRTWGRVETLCKEAGVSVLFVLTLYDGIYLRTIGIRHLRRLLKQAAEKEKR